jgi:histone H4
MPKAKTATKSVGGKKMPGGFGKRHRNVPTRNPLAAFSRPAIKRLARRGGTKIIAVPCYEEVRDAAMKEITRIVAGAYVFTQYKHRRTIAYEDVCHAIKALTGTTLYG